MWELYLLLDFNQLISLTLKNEERTPTLCQECAKTKLQTDVDIIPSTFFFYENCTRSMGLKFYLEITAFVAISTHHRFMMIWLPFPSKASASSRYKFKKRFSEIDMRTYCPRMISYQLCIQFSKNKMTTQSTPSRSAGTVRNLHRLIAWHRRTSLSGQLLIVGLFLLMLACTLRRIFVCTNETARTWSVYSRNGRNDSVPGYMLSLSCLCSLGLMRIYFDIEGCPKKASLGNVQLRPRVT